MQNHTGQQREGAEQGNDELQRLLDEREPAAFEGAESDDHPARYFRQFGLLVALNPDANRAVALDPGRDNRQQVAPDPTHNRPGKSAKHQVQGPTRPETSSSLTTHRTNQCHRKVCATNGPIQP